MVDDVVVEELIPAMVFRWMVKFAAFPRNIPRKLSLSATTVEPKLLSEISQF